MFIWFLHVRFCYTLLFRIYEIVQIKNKTKYRVDWIIFITEKSSLDGNDK
jgi:hypothetical protein